MSQAKAIFILDCLKTTIQCFPDETMRDICQRFSFKVGESLNSLIFLYGGNHLNFELKFKDQANIIDKKNNEMKILVYRNENNELICPNCGEKIKLKLEVINDLLESNNKIRESINGIKFQIENIILLNNSLLNSINIQLKNINIVLNSIDEDVKNNNKKIKNLLDNSEEKKYNSNKNFIIGIIDIKENDVNKEIRIINSFEQMKREYTYSGNPENDHIYENEKEIKEKCIIKINNKIIPFNYKYKFDKKGVYIIEYSFSDLITKTNFLFLWCDSFIYFDLSNFNTKNVNNMRSMFNGCESLLSINLSNIKTQNVINMWGMFFKCESLTNLDLSSFDTVNVTNIRSMFHGCKLISNLNLSNFNIQKVTDMYLLFSGCVSLKVENLITYNETIKNLLK